MASAAVGCGSASASWAQFKNSSSSIRNMRNNDNSNKYNKRKGMRVSCVKSVAVSDPYKTLRIQRGASESEVKKAFRQLALQYHPDVCREKDSGVQFHQITEAYNTLMTTLRSEQDALERSRALEKSRAQHYKEDDQSLRYDEDDLWEEWMGWEGAGIRDYTSHINPYI